MTAICGDRENEKNSKRVLHRFYANSCGIIANKQRKIYVNSEKRAMNCDELRWANENIIQVEGCAA